MIVSCVTLIVNLLLLGAAHSDRSLGAFGIAIMWGPIINALILLVSLACIPIVKMGTSALIGSYVAVAIALPLLAIPVDFGIIANMGLHGC